MSKNDFIKNLKKALEGSVSTNEVEAQINYYNDYIESEKRKGISEGEVIESLGDPRLIAKTIIDTNGNFSDNYVYESNSSNYREENSKFKSSKFKINTWYAKIIGIIVLILIVVLMIAVGGLIGYVLLRFAIPIIIIVLFLALFRRR